MHIILLHDEQLHFWYYGTIMVMLLAYLILSIPAVQGWTCTQVFEGHSHYVMQVVFNPKDTNTFASASLDRTVKVMLTSVILGSSQLHVWAASPSVPCLLGKSSLEGRQTSW